MNPYMRGALFVIRLLASGLMLISLLWGGADLVQFLGNKRPAVAPLWLVLKTVPFLVGALLLIKSRAIAKRLTQDFE